MLTKFLSIVIGFLKKDLGLKIGRAFLASGVMLLGGFQVVINIAPSTATATLQSSQSIVCFIGVFLIVIGAGILLHRYYLWNIENSTQDIALFYFPGFTNINPHPPLNALPNNKRKKATLFTNGKFDSYNTQLIVKEYSHLCEIVERRSGHTEMNEAYIAALGSVPYLYLVGTLFRDGHMPTQILEHNRSTDKWHQLETFGKPESLNYSYNHIIGKESIMAIESNDNDEIGVSISFTHQVKNIELPKSININTVDISLVSGQSFDAIPCEYIQDNIVKEVSHLLTSLAKKSSKLHLLISAQASIILKLGKAYHNNMTGTVVIYNYDPKIKSYNWGIEFNGSKTPKIITFK